MGTSGVHPHDERVAPQFLRQPQHCLLRRVSLARFSPGTANHARARPRTVIGSPG